MERFWEKVRKTKTCWIWTGCRNKRGFGLFNLDGSGGQKACLIAWFFLKDIPPPKRAIHVCGNFSCVNPEHLRESRLDIRELFWRNVHKKSKNQCWEWRGNIGYNGYGRFTLTDRRGRSKTMLAHRVSYELSNETKPRNFIMHSCDNKKCVNPDHLSDGTPKENSYDAIEKGIWDPGKKNRSKIFCKNGHPFSGNNLILVRRGRISKTSLYKNNKWRQCRECNRIRSNQRNLRLRKKNQYGPFGRGRLECKRGHKLSGDNLLLRIGSKACRSCRNWRARRYWAKKHGEPKVFYRPRVGIPRYNGG